MKKNVLGVSILLGLSPLAAQAGEPFSYTFVDASYVYADIDGPIDGDGWRVDGSLAVHDNVFLFANYQDLDLDSPFDDAQFWNAGVGFNLPLGALPIDLVLKGGYADQDVNPGPSDNGFTVSGGVRVDLAILELEGNVNYYDVDGPFEDFTIDAAARLYVLPFLALQAGAEFDEEFEDATYLAGLRLEFGGLNPAE